MSKGIHGLRLRHDDLGVLRRKYGGGSHTNDRRCSIHIHPHSRSACHADGLPSGTTAYSNPSATGTVLLQAGSEYTVQVEILRNDLGGGYGSEYVSAIYVGSTNIGWCAPNGGDYDCTFYTCSATHTFTPTTSSVALSINVEGHSWDCDCDMTTWVCSAENTVAGRTPMTAVARYTFTPTA